jgi:hypothetical protein
MGAVFLTYGAGPSEFGMSWEKVLIQTNINTEQINEMDFFTVICF